MTENQFLQELEEEGIFLNLEQQAKLDKFYQMVVKTNQTMNLTRITNKEEFYLKHFYDSLTLNKVISLNKEKTLCDIGSGAGFPGIVLKIIYPSLKITLIDALEKRVQFLNQVIKELDLKDISAIHARMEEYAKQNEEKFDIITSRAVAKTNIILELSVKSLKIGGYILLLKGEAKEELEEASSAIQTLKLELKETKSFYLYKEENYRTILKFQKKAKTPSGYPRDFSKIKKMPL